ncbi:MAG: GPR endopeptidase, partial [Clostridiales bacterium]|nr:GPR endopeptidase [Clostridiales bacterium]
TDLAIECKEEYGESEIEGVKYTEKYNETSKTTIIEVLNKKGEFAIGKPVGNYITVEVPNFSSDGEILDDRLTAIKEELARLIPNDGVILVVGLGNDNITPDALGPRTIDKIIATRHISAELAKSVGLEGLRMVSALAPGVLGQTGIETGEIIMGVSKSVKPSAVITVDALASRRLSRLGCTVQIADTGVTPGSGVGNARAQINEQTLGVPVIAVGVPTVVDAATLANDLLGDNEEDKDLFSKLDGQGANMIVTPREIDLMIDRAAKLLALAINSALQPTLTAEDIMAMTS